MSLEGEVVLRLLPDIPFERRELLVGNVDVTSVDIPTHVSLQIFYIYILLGSICHCMLLEWNDFIL